MKKNVEIQWWKGENREPPHYFHSEALMHSAIQKIAKDVEDGFVFGELHENIVDSKFPGDGVEYQGYWCIRSVSEAAEKHFAVSGRIPRQDEDTCLVFLAKNREEAVKKFEAAIWENEDQATRDDVFESHRTYVYITAVFCSDSPITIA